MLVLMISVLIFGLLVFVLNHINPHNVSAVIVSSDIVASRVSTWDEDVFLRSGREVVSPASPSCHCDEQELIEIIVKEDNPSRDEIVEMLSSLLSLSDHAFFVHCEHTAEHVRGFAEHLGVSTRVQTQLVYAARLHLLGLLGAPRGFLSKLSKGLNLEEQAIWEFHATLGGQKLEQMCGFKEIAKIIKSYMSSRALQQEGAHEFGASERLTQEDLYYGLILKMCSLYELELSLQRKHRRGAHLAAEYALQRVRMNIDVQTHLELLDAFGDFIIARAALESRELELSSIDGLEVGMVLSRPIQTSAGLPMFESGLCVNQEILERLRLFEELCQERFTLLFVWS